MQYNSPKRNRWLVEQAPVWILALLGLWLVVIRPLGPCLALLPGDLGDGRFNNYLLEHFYRWLSGADPNYWNATFFYPFPNTIAFSDNLLGSAPIYAMERALGLDRETAFQAWYILGYALNFAAAAYALQRLRLKPLAAASGAFIFTFGLPILAQENHVQLLYRLGIPLACVLLWDFFNEPALKKLVGVAFWLTWQMAAGIYMGIFLGILLAVMAVLMPLFVPLAYGPPAQARWITRAALAIWKALILWPLKLKQGWNQATPIGRLAATLAIFGLGLCLGGLLWPYYQVTTTYGFYRHWDEVALMLPQVRSYFIADASLIWKPVSSLIPNFNARGEHQLFPGGMVLLLILAGITWRFSSRQRRMAFLHLTAALVLVVMTLNIHGFSLFHALWSLPGMKSLRAVTRVELAFIWPLAIFASYVIDALVRKNRPWLTAILYLVAGLLVIESALYNHAATSKVAAQACLAPLRAQLATLTLPVNPVLLVARPPSEPWYVPEIDGMLLAQELGWPTLNGYSGNFPPGFKAADSCQRFPDQIKNYMTFARISDPSFYLSIMQRVVPLGFSDCNPAWWAKTPH